MESFPDGMHVRLQNRSYGQYLHADKDGVCVSLRGSWTRALPSTEWVLHRHQRDGSTYILLRSAANAGYLASKFKVARRSHNRFVHVRHKEASEVVDALCLWEVFRAPGGGDDVILRHGSNAVLAAVSTPQGVTTLDVDDQTPTMAIRWIVAQATPIPPRPGPQVLPVPPKAIGRGALIKSPWRCNYCEKATFDCHPVCISCVPELNNLLDASKDEMIMPNSYCLVCHQFCGEDHILHDSRTVLIDFQENVLAAIVTGKEAWAGIFKGIQSDFFGYIHLYTPEGARCIICCDLLQRYGQGFYEGPYHFCSLKCFVQNRGGTPVVHLAEKILRASSERGANAFCLPCEIAFNMQQDDAHAAHEFVNIIADSDKRSRVLVPSEHPLILQWSTIKNWPAADADRVEFLIRDSESKRCQHCNVRLVRDHVKYCTLECSLNWQNQYRLIPRPLQLNAWQT